MGLSKGLAQRWHNQPASPAPPLPSGPSPASFPFPAASAHPALLQRNGRSLDNASILAPLSTLKLPSTILGVKVPNRRGMAFGLPLASCLQANFPLRRLDPSSSKLSGSLADTQKFIPPIAVRCLEYLNQRGPEEEGIYRIPGRSTDVDKLRTLFDAGCDIDLLKHTIGTLDPHAVASTFKLWLRELPDSLLSQEFDVQINEIVSRYSGSEARTQPGIPLPPPPLSGLVDQQIEECVRQLSNILPGLPLPNWHLLRAIADHLSILSQSSSTNRMTLTNLRLILSPTLKFTPIFLQLLVEHRHSLFKQPCRSLLPSPPNTHQHPHPSSSKKQTSASSPQLSIDPSAHSSVPRQVPSTSSTAQQILASRSPNADYFGTIDRRPRTAAAEIAFATTTTATSSTTTTPTTTAITVTPILHLKEKFASTRSRHQSCASPVLAADLLPTITTSAHWAFEDSMSKFMIHSPPPPDSAEPIKTTTKPTTKAPLNVPQDWTTGSSLVSNPFGSLGSRSAMVDITKPLRSPTPISDMFKNSPASAPPTSTFPSTTSSIRTRTDSLTHDSHLTSSTTPRDRTISTIHNRGTNHDERAEASSTQDRNGGFGTGFGGSGRPSPGTIPWLSDLNAGPMLPPSALPSRSASFASLISQSGSSTLTTTSKTPIADLYKRSNSVFSSCRSITTGSGITLDSLPEVEKSTGFKKKSERIYKPTHDHSNSISSSSINSRVVRETHRREISHVSGSSNTLLSDDDDDDNDKSSVVLDEENNSGLMMLNNKKKKENRDTRSSDMTVQCAHHHQQQQQHHHGQNQKIKKWECSSGIGSHKRKSLDHEEEEEEE